MIDLFCVAHCKCERLFPETLNQASQVPPPFTYLMVADNDRRYKL